MVIKFAIRVLRQLCGGEEGNLQIYKCTMSHNKNVCVDLYLEDEYEMLILECNWKAKTKMKHFQQSLLL